MSAQFPEREAAPLHTDAPCYPDDILHSYIFISIYPENDIIFLTMGN